VDFGASLDAVAPTTIRTLVIQPASSSLYW